jgi:glutamine synthetase
MDSNLFTRQAEDFLSRHPEIDGFELLFPDINGVLRGKWLPRAALGKLAGGGVRLPRSTYALNIDGEDVDATGLALSCGDPDGICLPVPGSLAPMPWTKPPMAQLMMSMVEADGRTPCPYDPRQVLARVLARFAERKLTPVVATELEFYLIDARQGPAGRPRPPRAPASGKRHTGSQLYDLDIMADFAPVLQEIAAICRQQDIPADTTIAEFGPGQFEINLVHGDDALRMADQTVLFRRVVKHVAARHNMAATFMAKPYGDQPGNGLHVHASIVDGAGNNIFAGKAGELNEALAGAVGGVLASMADAQAIFAPNANSYRRFQPGSFAPIAPCWGFDHRAVAVRIPTSAGKDARLEHRVAGADANPYLVLAAILSAMLDGLERKAKPGAPVSGQLEPGDYDPLSRDWHRALDHFEASDFVRTAFGDEYARVYAACRRNEADKQARAITDYEYAAYLLRF